MTRPRFGIRLEAKRRAKGFTIEDLAELLDVSSITIFRWEKGEGLPKAKVHIEKLKKMLTFTEAELAELFEEFLLNHAKGGPQYKMQGFEYVENSFESWESFLDKLEEIDLRAMPNTNSEREGPSEYWAPIFRENPYSWSVLTFMDEVVGYWHYIPLTERAFLAAKAGELVETDLSREDMDSVVEEKDYTIYISMVVVDYPHRIPEASAVLKKSFVKHVSGLARRGYFFSEFCAYAATPAGEDLCRLLGMHRTGTTIDGREPIYYMKGSDVCRNGILKGDSTIRRLYLKKFG